MSSRIARFAAIVALAGALALPQATVAAQPASVTAWQAHLAEMQALPGPLGQHIKDCVAMHGSMAGLLGPNGEMVAGMAG